MGWEWEDKKIQGGTERILWETDNRGRRVNATRREFVSDNKSTFGRTPAQTNELIYGEYHRGEKCYNCDGPMENVSKTTRGGGWLDHKLGIPLGRKGVITNVKRCSDCGREHSY